MKVINEPIENHPGGGDVPGLRVIKRSNNNSIPEVPDIIIENFWENKPVQTQQVYLNQSDIDELIKILKEMKK